MTLAFKEISMVHHLHDDKRFSKIIGSISLKKFEEVVKSKDIIFTFDDGYKDHYNYVFPHLVKNKISGSCTFFWECSVE